MRQHRGYVFGAVLALFDVYIPKADRLEQRLQLFEAGVGQREARAVVASHVIASHAKSQREPAPGRRVRAIGGPDVEESDHPVVQGAVHARHQVACDAAWQAAGS
jgi:hypothetical protein